MYDYFNMKVILFKKTNRFCCCPYDSLNLFKTIVVWNLELGYFASRFSLVNKIEIWKTIYVELFAARILN